MFPGRRKTTTFDNGQWKHEHSKTKCYGENRWMVAGCLWAKRPITCRRRIRDKSILKMVVSKNFTNSWLQTHLLARWWSRTAWRCTFAARWNRYSCSNLAVPCGSFSADTLISGSVKYLQHHSKNSVVNTAFGDDSSSLSSICNSNITGKFNLGAG